jgi:hypothetical protein
MDVLPVPGSYSEDIIWSITVQDNQPSTTMPPAWTAIRLQSFDSFATLLHITDTSVADLPVPAPVGYDAWALPMQGWFIDVPWLAIATAPTQYHRCPSRCRLTLGQYLLPMAAPVDAHPPQCSIAEAPVPPMYTAGPDPVVVAVVMVLSWPVPPFSIHCIIQLLRP